MTKENVMDVLENVLNMPPNAVFEGFELSGAPGWDSLGILNLEMELSTAFPDVRFTELRGCKTAGDVLALCAL